MGSEQALSISGMDLISSRSNPKIKQVRALRQPKARQDGEAFIVEGIHHVGAAVESNVQIIMAVYAPNRLHSDYAQDLLHELSRRGVACLAVTNDVFESLAEKENPQGILAVVQQPKTILSDLYPENFPWGVALVDPQDPGNVGTILRTIDAVGASGMLLLSSGASSAGLVDPYQPGAVRASLGALFWYPVVSTTFTDFSQWAAANHYHLYGTSAHGAVDYGKIVRYDRPGILLLGSERAGLTVQQAAVCECLIRLPMHGHTTSLNLAIAAGVMLYDMLGKFN
jgi:RNA methyltransferase, TrmH family